MKNFVCLVAVLCIGVTFAGETFNLGTLPSDGTTVTRTDSLVSYDLDYFNFTLAGNADGTGGSFLTIETSGYYTLGGFDTEIGLYTADGFYVEDNDDIDLNGGNWNSILIFDGSNPLLAGDYTLVVGGWNTAYGSTIDDISPGSNNGQYTIDFTSSTVSAVPAPSAVLLGTMGVGLVNWLRRKRSL